MQALMKNDKNTHVQRMKNACLNLFSSQAGGNHFNFISARCLKKEKKKFFFTFFAAPDQMHGTQRSYSYLINSAKKEKSIFKYYFE